MLDNIGIESESLFSRALESMGLAWDSAPGSFTLQDFYGEQTYQYSDKFLSNFRSKEQSAIVELQMSVLDTVTGSPKQSWASNWESRPPAIYSPSAHILCAGRTTGTGCAHCGQTQIKRWLEKSKRCLKRGKRIAISITSSACSATIPSVSLVWD